MSDMQMLITEYDPATDEDIAEDVMPLDLARLKEELCELMSSTIVMYFQTHGAHWNVRGSDFFQYHDLFATIYEDLYSSIDPFAENVRKIGFDAPFSMIEFLMEAEIQPVETAFDPISLSVALMEMNNVLIESVQETFLTATALNEQGIANFLADRLDMHRKWGWQLSASTNMPADMIRSAKSVVSETRKELGQRAYEYAQSVEKNIVK